MTLAKCHPSRKAQARGLCKSCYDRLLKKENPTYKRAQESNTTRWARANPDKMRAIQKRRQEREKSDPAAKLRKRNDQLRKYGWTQADYDLQLSKQNGGCAICFRKPGKTRLHVDHCHKTNRVRGILCHQCNWYLGTIDADPSILDRIGSYLEVPEPEASCTCEPWVSRLACAVIQCRKAESPFAGVDCDCECHG